MTKRKPKATLPPVVVHIREGPVGPAQQSAYRRLWDRLLASQEEAPAPGGDNRGGDGGADDGAKPQNQA